MTLLPPTSWRRLLVVVQLLCCPSFYTQMTPVEINQKGGISLTAGVSNLQACQIKQTRCLIIYFTSVAQIRSGHPFVMHGCCICTQALLNYKGEQHWIGSTNGKRTQVIRGGRHHIFWFVSYEGGSGCSTRSMHYMWQSPSLWDYQQPWAGKSEVLQNVHGIESFKINFYILTYFSL